MMRLILAHVVFAILESLPQLHTLLNLASLSKVLHVLLCWQHRQLVRCIETMCLFFASMQEERITYCLHWPVTPLNSGAVLLSVVHKSTVSKIGDVQIVLLVEDRHEYRRATHLLDLGVGIVQHVQRVELG